MPHPYRLDSASSSLIESLGSVVRDQIAPRAAEVDAKGSFPAEQLDALRKLGLFGISIPKELGGLGLGPRAFVAAAEEIATGCASTAMIYVMHVAATQAIAGSTTLAQKDALLREVASGKHLTTLAFSEKGSRSQFWAPVSQLKADGDGFVVDADKSWVTSAKAASSYVALAQKPGAANPGESTLFLVRKASTVNVGAAGFDGLGLRGNDSAPVKLERHRVASGDLLCEQGKSEALVMGAVLPWFAIGTAAMANGLSRAAFAATQKHLTGTGFQHTGTLLRDLHNLRVRLATMSVRTDQSRALLGHTLDHLEAPSEITPLFVLESRLAALNAATDVTDLAMKTCGGAAFSKHIPVERLFRDARAGWVMAPTADHLE
ncbi:MAG: acyl-CoA dehydrogenase family protein, partial [Polyangiales bacterium]